MSMLSFSIVLIVFLGLHIFFLLIYREPRPSTIHRSVTGQIFLSGDSIYIIFK